MVMIRHINRNGYKLQRILKQLNYDIMKKEQLRKKEREKQLEKELQRETRLLRSYGRATYVNVSPCYNCTVKQFCKASGIEHYSISERDCKKIKKFIAMKIAIRRTL